MKQKPQKPAAKVAAPKPKPATKRQSAFDTLDCIEDVAMDTLAPSQTGEIGIWTKRLIRLLRTLERCHEVVGYLQQYSPACDNDPVHYKRLTAVVHSAVQLAEKSLTYMVTSDDPVDKDSPAMAVDFPDEHREVEAAFMAVLDDPTAVSHLARVLDEFGNVLPRPLVFRVLLNNWDNTDITEKDSELMMATEVNFTNGD
jgi:hypothetical protein